MYKKHVKENIKYLRSKSGMTQNEFGALFGVSRDNIASYERGSEPKIDFITRLVDYFQITYDDFIGTLLEENTDLVYSHPETDAMVNEPARNYSAGTGSPVKEKSGGWQNIPLYELPVTARLSGLFEEPQNFQPIDYFAASTLPRCDGGLRINGDGLAPIVRSGDIVFYRQVNEIPGSILWGEMYLLSFEIDGDEYITVKYLYESGRDGYIRLAGHEADPVNEIALSRVKALGLVKATCRLHTLR